MSELDDKLKLVFADAEPIDVTGDAGGDDLNMNDMGDDLGGGLEGDMGDGGLEGDIGGGDMGGGFDFSTEELPPILQLFQSIVQKKLQPFYLHLQFLSFEDHTFF